jgi:very-short-patch-repair endonuclease
MAKHKRSTLEQGFQTLWNSYARARGLPQAVREFRFAKNYNPPRQWRFDFAWPEHHVAVEIDGGIFVGGGHNRGLQFSDNADKLNAATVNGWKILKFTTLSLREKPVQCIELVASLLSQQEVSEPIIRQKELL